LAKLNKYKKVSFLLSGTGTNLVELLKKNLVKKNFEVTSIISNNIIPINIKFIVNKFYKNILVKENQKRLIKKDFNRADIIFSVGYMKVIEKNIIENFDVINLHPSILPKYKGLMTQKRMLINNEKMYGFTIHKVSNLLDEGEIISNKIKKINTNDELKLMHEHKSLEHQFVYKQLVNYLLS